MIEKCIMKKHSGGDTFMFDWLQKNKGRKEENEWLDKTNSKQSHHVHLDLERDMRKKSSFRFPLIPDESFYEPDLSHLTNSNVRTHPQDHISFSMRRKRKEQLRPIDVPESHFASDQSHSLAKEFKGTDTTSAVQKRVRHYSSGVDFHPDHQPAFFRRKNLSAEKNPFRNELRYVDAYQEKMTDSLQIFEEKKSPEPQRFFRPTPFISPVHGKMDGGSSRKNPDFTSVFSSNRRSQPADSSQGNKAMDTKAAQNLMPSESQPTPFSGASSDALNHVLSDRPSEEILKDHVTIGKDSDKKSSVPFEEDIVAVKPLENLSKPVEIQHNQEQISSDETSEAIHPMHHASERYNEEAQSLQDMSDTQSENVLASHEKKLDRYVAVDTASQYDSIPEHAEENQGLSESKETQKLNQDVVFVEEKVKKDCHLVSSASQENFVPSDAPMSDEVKGAKNALSNVIEDEPVVFQNAERDKMQTYLNMESSASKAVSENVYSVHQGSNMTLDLSENRNEQQSVSSEVLSNQNVKINASAPKNSKPTSSHQEHIPAASKAQHKHQPERLIPINVMMLNEDKYYLKRKEMERTMNQTAQTQPVQVQDLPLNTGNQISAPVHSTDFSSSVTMKLDKQQNQTPSQDDKKISNQDRQIEMQHSTSAMSNVPMQEQSAWSPIERTELLVAQDADHPDTKLASSAVASKQEALDLINETEICAYQFPSFDLLNSPADNLPDIDYSQDEKVAILDQVLKDFHVGGKVVSMTKGPTVTRYEVQPDPGVKVNKIVNLADDLKLYLAAQDIRIEAPIPGKSMVGIEVPNDHPRSVSLREILSHPEFQTISSNTRVALGLNIEGRPVSTDIRKMPHGLIAGSTGSGKSVCINSILISLLFQAHPDEVKLMLIDPKMVELAIYNSIPHLVCPVITDAKAATKALKWAVDEMERRYELFSKIAVRDIERYNDLAMRDPRGEKMPSIIIIIDELADLMMVAANDVETCICRIAQKARACGIHLLLATQRPSVDVITGLIKSNIPSRIAFAVSSQIDSRTILDTTGAERLLGKGDMLLSESGSSKLVRVQGTYVSDDEIEQVVAFVKNQMAPQYLFSVEEMVADASLEEEDELFPEVLAFVIEAGAASTSMIQRKFRIGYNRAARMIDLLEEKGYISAANGSKPREVFIDQL